MKENAPIGFFDSGVGGLSVYARFKKLMPSENTIYFGDLKNLPYGNKTKSELVGFATNILNFFKSKQVKAAVIACNTSSALAYNEIKDSYDFKIYPIIQVSAKLISSCKYNKIGVFATEGTVSSGAYKKELSKYSKNIEVKEIACPNWVPMVEYKIKKNNNDIKQHIEEMLEFNPDKIILGCTHYPYLLDLLTEFAPREIFIDPAKLFVDYIKTDIIKNNSTTSGKEEFFVTANPESFVDNAKLFYNVKNLPQIIEFNDK